MLARAAILRALRAHWSVKYSSGWYSCNHCTTDACEEPLTHRGGCNLLQSKRLAREFAKVSNLIEIKAMFDAREVGDCKWLAEAFATPANEVSLVFSTTTEEVSPVVKITMIVERQRKYRTMLLKIGVVEKVTL